MKKTFDKIDPFAPETFVLRAPIRKGEAEYRELTLRPPLLKDILRTDGRDPESVGYALALLSSLSGVPESALGQIVPEDWADLRVSLARTNMRFLGAVNLLDEREGPEDGDPTAAANTPPRNSGTTSGA